MAVENFDVAQFDRSLPGNNGPTKRKWLNIGVQNGEYCWVFEFEKYPTICIIVRSSIKGDGMSAGTGEDSIRLGLVRKLDSATYLGMGQAKDLYTTRTKGWETRLKAKIYELGERVKKIIKPYDNTEDVFFVHKEGPNKGRPFATRKLDGKGFRWLD